LNDRADGWRRRRGSSEEPQKRRRRDSSEESRPASRDEAENDAPTSRRMRETLERKLVIMAELEAKVTKLREAVLEMEEQGGD